ncbi:MAG: hypothetical protein LUF35_12020 [Lachnospiraceae bacterium]|nr:hypothetical protein [Lachnospiraceae bacterium]
MDDLDQAIQTFFGRPEMIAEIVNRLFYRKDRVQPSEMTMEDTMPVFQTLGKSGGALSPVEYRQEYSRLFLAGTGTFHYTLFVETEVNYELPLKAFLFEGGLYMTEAEGWDVSENDGKLLPCLTVVLYLSPNAWGGYYHLHETYRQTKEELIKLAPDYHLNIIEPVKLSDETIAGLSGDLAGVLRFTKTSKDRRSVEEFLEGGAYAELSENARELISCLVEYQNRENPEIPEKTDHMPEL